MYTFKMEDLSFETVDKYIEQFPENVKEILLSIRKIIQQNAPDATEMIAYKMPAYKLQGKPLVYFAGYKNHIGFYATPTGHEQFSGEFARYKQGKGSVQFPVNEPMPHDLIARIVKFRMAEILEKQNSK